MKNISFSTLLSSALVFAGACDEFIQIEPPRTDLIKATVFSSDATATAAMIDIYYQVGCIGFGSGNTNSITLLTALSSDELINGITYNKEFQQISTNDILPANSMTTFLWQDMYSCIYRCNAILEGLADSDQISKSLSQQLIGEAKFFRAFCHFYLLNLFGEIPLSVTTDYKVNEKAERADKMQIYDQVISDLIDAQNHLAVGYAFSEGERIRVNRMVANAFLARVYLYSEKWRDAEIQASAVIESGNYWLEEDLTDVFLKNSDETIFQFYPSENGYTNDAITFLGYGFSLRPELVSSFEEGDLRKTYWVGNGIFGPFDYPVKYLSYDGSFSEYSMVFRLAEQYLIRAEARAKLDDLVGALEDVNAVRKRAGLMEMEADDATSLLAAIQHERRVELFAEWGHRWFDLKRTRTIDEALTPFKAEWTSTDLLYPIPEIQLQNSPMVQNPGYPGG